MNQQNPLHTWKNSDQGVERQARLPENEGGQIELTESELAEIGGGRTPEYEGLVVIVAALSAAILHYGRDYF